MISIYRALWFKNFSFHFCFCTTTAPYWDNFIWREYWDLTSHGLRHWLRLSNLWKMVLFGHSPYRFFLVIFHTKNHFYQRLWKFVWNSRDSPRNQPFKFRMCRSNSDTWNEVVNFKPGPLLPGFSFVLPLLEWPAGILS